MMIQVMISWKIVACVFFTSGIYQRFFCLICEFDIHQIGLRVDQQVQTHTHTYRIQQSRLTDDKSTKLMDGI